MLSFGNSFFLFALAGLAVPIILHLINRELAVNLKFPSVRFIKKAQLPRRERRSLRDLLLLLFRLLLFTAVVLAFAQPSWVTPVAEGEQVGELKQTVYLLDASSSMAASVKWENALRSIRADISDTSEEQHGLVVYADKIVVEQVPLNDDSAVESILGELNPSYAAGRPGLAVEVAGRIFSGDAQKRLVIISDFQETDWQTDLPGLAEDVVVEFVSVKSAALDNVGIVNVNTYPIDNSKLRAQVSVKNFSENDVEIEVTVAGNEQTFSQSLTLSAGQMAHALFELDITEATAFVTSIKEDSYAHDNQWHFWASPPPEIRVYAFLPNLDEPQAVESFFFMQTALEIESESDWVRFQVTSLDHGFFDDMISEEADVLIFPATGSYLRDEQWEYLGDFVKAGGTAIMLPGESFPKMYRSLKNNGFMNSTFLGMAGTTNERQNPFHLGAVNTGTKMARMFSDEAAKDLYLVNIYKYIRVQHDPRDLALLSFENGAPAVLNTVMGEGNMFTSLFAFDPNWTDLPLRNSFLPLVRELVLEGFDVNRLRNRVFIEDGIADSSLEWAGIPVALSKGDELWEINVNPGESVNELVDIVDWLPSVLSRTPINSRRVVDESPAFGVEKDENLLWPWLLLIALACFIFESLLTGIKDVSGVGGKRKGVVL